MQISLWARKIAIIALKYIKCDYIIRHFYV